MPPICPFHQTIENTTTSLAEDGQRIKDNADRFHKEVREGYWKKNSFLSYGTLGLILTLLGLGSTWVISIQSVQAAQVQRINSMEKRIDKIDALNNNLVSLQTKVDMLVDYFGIKPGGRKPNP